MFTRRGIFQLAAGAAAMVALPRTAVPEAVHAIYGESLWEGLPVCDAAGIEALVRGEAVNMSTIAAKAVRRADGFYDFGNMVMHIRRPIVFDNLFGTTMQNMEIRAHGDLPFFFSFTETATHNTLRNINIKVIA